MRQGHREAGGLHKRSSLQLMACHWKDVRAVCDRHCPAMHRRQSDGGKHGEMTLQRRYHACSDMIPPLHRLARVPVLMRHHLPAAGRQLHAPHTSWPYSCHMQHQSGRLQVGYSAAAMHGPSVISHCPSMYSNDHALAIGLRSCSSPVHATRLSCWHAVLTLLCCAAQVCHTEGAGLTSAAQQRAAGHLH